MSTLLKVVFIVGAKRTAFGAVGGKLKVTTFVHLGEAAAKAALQAANVTPDLVDSVVVGNIGQCSAINGPYISRHVALRSGVPNHVPCLTVNRQCGSGFQAVITGAQNICLHDLEIALTVGSENSSEAPLLIRGSRFDVKFSQTPQIECPLWSSTTDYQLKIPMGITAENMAEKYNITREECNKFALRSQQNWKKANDNGYFNEEMAPILFKNRKTGADELFNVDEHDESL
ncbi:3-ketoacyl-CoA thiolase-like protein [Dinothrombium tinctorium]|uniref:3-ketoacyl-CoA thiolase-like protein n=1 Tax=Dinothrombium tinctorium TaxID=1965070 RepID=A0A443Q9E8_9ACAR|nr:3-ketoacyl-CoA thiolase-like protein [Dinothrombium tinctorium]